MQDADLAQSVGLIFLLLQSLDLKKLLAALFYPQDEK